MVEPEDTYHTSKPEVDSSVTPTYTKPKPTQKTKASYKNVAIGALVLLILIVAAAVGAMLSLPGDALYGIKTNVVEKTLEKFHANTKSKASYQVTLMQNRLAEVKELATQESVSEEDKALIISNITNRTAILESLIDSSIDSAFPKTDVLFVLNDFASVAGAIENISENNPNLQSVGDTAEDARNTAESLYKKRATSFVQTETPESVYSYIADQLKTVKEGLSKGEVSEDVKEKAELYLDRVNPAIAKSDLAKVIISIAEAHRFVTTEVYSGVIIENQPIENTTKTNATSTIQATTPSSTLEINTPQVTAPQ